MKSTIPTKNKIEAEKGIKIEAFRKGIRKTVPHKHNSYFEIIYLSKGSGYHTIDTQQYSIAPPTLFFVRKEQVHHWEIDSEPEGYVIIIKKSFIDSCMDDQLRLFIQQLSNHHSLRISNSTTIESLFQLLTEEKTPDNHYTEGLLKALMAKMFEASEPHTSTKAQKPTLFQTFQELLSQHKSVKNNVAYYAQRLKTTPQNLNAVCQKSAQQSANSIIAEHIVSEAKRLLIYSPGTISQIAYTLDFSDPSHFVKYFKRVTGKTPNTFRKEQE